MGWSLTFYEEDRIENSYLWIANTLLQATSLPGISKNFDLCRKTSTRKVNAIS